MKRDKKYYKPIDLANYYNIHPNTIRLYERLEYISLAERSANNYREFSELHILQVEICRCIFGYPFTNQRIRNAGNEVMWASAKKQWDLGKQCAHKYIQVIRQEHDLAQETAQILQNWANAQKEKIILDEQKYFSRKEVAELLGVTVEAVRNWERNSLIFPSSSGMNNEKLYNDKSMERIRVVYMLRQAGYSIAAIHNSISMYDIGQINMILPALNMPKQDDLISVGDRWLSELSELVDAAEKIPPIFLKMELL